jgi:hypothetical protein
LPKDFNLDEVPTNIFDELLKLVGVTFREDEIH